MDSYEIDYFDLWRAYLDLQQKYDKLLLASGDHNTIPKFLLNRDVTEAIKRNAERA